MTKSTAAATPCECSKYDALPGDLTEKQVETGDFEIWTTKCVATTRNLFAPGHDAKLKSFLITHAALGNEIRRNEGGVATSQDAAGHASRYEFAHMVVAGITKAQAKAKAKAEREAARAAKKAAKGKPAERKLAESAGVVAPKPLAQVVAEEEAKHAAEVAAARPEPEWDDEPQAKTVNLTGRPEVIAKVGRWSYKGIEKDGVFYYLAKDGHTRKETTKYTVERTI